MMNTEDRIKKLESQVLRLKKDIANKVTTGEVFIFSVAAMVLATLIAS